VGRLQRVAEHDLAVASAFSMVAGLRARPTAMMAPRIILKAIRGPRRPRGSR
jgi:hypothetical protein